MSGHISLCSTHLQLSCVSYDHSKHLLPFSLGETFLTENSKKDTENLELSGNLKGKDACKEAAADIKKLHEDWPVFLDQKELQHDELSQGDRQMNIHDSAPIS